jgi:uncharacterized protein YjiK
MIGTSQLKKVAMRLTQPAIARKSTSVFASSLPVAAARFRTLKRFGLLSAVLIFAAMSWSTAGNEFKFLLNPLLRSALAFQQMTAGESVREQAIWLPDFHVEIDARPIVGIKADLSGLTYDPDRNSLFGITNKRPEIVELSLSGELLRRIPLSGVVDPEAIEYVAPGRYVVSDERRQALIELSIDAHTERLDLARNNQLSIGMGRNGNKGFEGLAYDRAGDRLLVAKEGDPMAIYEITGFPFSHRSAPAVQIESKPDYAAALPLRDLSSLHFDARTGHVLALSDESQRIVELDKRGKPVSTISLGASSHGLAKRIPQAEGVSMDAAGNLYVISEPNLFYKFSRREAGAVQ